MLLDKITRSIVVVLATAYTVANSIKMTVEWEDRKQEKVVPVTNLLTGVIGSNTLVPVPDNSQAREIKELTIYNGDSVAHDVTVNLVDGVNSYTVKFAAALPANKTLYYNRLTGWVIV